MRELLRIAAVRWVTAEAIPFACLFIGLLLARELSTAGTILGVLIGMVGGTVLTVYFLYKVVGASAVWGVPLLLLLIPGTILGEIIFGHYVVHDTEHPNGTHLVITASYWLAWGLVLGGIAVVVMLAIVNGERWLKRNGAGDRVQSRGSLAASR